MQVLSASVTDLLQAGVCQQQAPIQASAALVAAPSSVATSDQKANGTAAGADMAAAEVEVATAGSQATRWCVFEVEVVLTITGTRITPSIAQFLVSLLLRSCLHCAVSQGLPGH